MAPTGSHHCLSNDIRITTLYRKVDFKAEVGIFLAVFIRFLLFVLLTVFISLQHLYTPSLFPSSCLLFSLSFSPNPIYHFTLLHLISPSYSLWHVCVSCPLWNPPLCHILFSSFYPVLIQFPPPCTAESRYWRKWVNSDCWVTGYSGPPVEENIAK